MIVKLTERQRVAIHRRYTATQDWGPGEDDVMARASAWHVLHLSDLDAKKIVFADLSPEPVEYDIPEPAVDHLLATLTSIPMIAGLALDMAGVMTALRAVRPAA